MKHAVSRTVGSMKFSHKAGSNMLLVAASVVAYEALRALLQRGRKEIEKRIVPDEEAPPEGPSAAADCVQPGTDAHEQLDRLEIDHYDTRPREGCALHCMSLVRRFHRAFMQAARTAC